MCCMLACKDKNVQNRSFTTRPCRNEELQCNNSKAIMIKANFKIDYSFNDTQNPKFPKHII